MSTNLPCPRARARFACEPLPARLLMAAGDPDNSFSSDGVATINFPGASFQVNDVALQSDGKVIAVGSKGSNIAVTRFNVDGTLDTTFGSAGLFESNRRTQATSVAIQADNKILLTFGESVPESLINMAVGRVHANGGGFDSGFGATGIAFVNVRRQDSSNAVSLQSDGKIIVVGRSGAPNEADMGIARYNTNGSPDTSFDDDGFVEVAFGEEEQALAVAVDYNGDPGSNPFYGTIVVVGDRRPSSSQPSTRCTICRLLSTGALDNRFDGDGKLTSPDLSPQLGESATGMQIQPGGKIVVTGTALAIAGSFQTGDFLVARYLSNGPIDTTFGPFGTGVVQTHFGGDERALDSAPSLFGGFLVSGRQDSAAAVAGYTADGLLEARFSGDGFMTAFGAAARIVTTLDTIAPFRRFVLGGGSSVGRYIDVATIVSLTADNTETSEATQATLTVTVERLDRLPTTQRIYINLGGTATPPTHPQFLTWDYTTSGITLAGFNVPRSYVEIPPNQTFTTFSITPINDTRPEGDETIQITTSSDPTYDLGTPSSATLVIRDNDIPGGPTVSASQFLDETAPHRVTFRFTQNVASSIAADDFQVSGPPGTPPFGFAYNPITNTATLSFQSIVPDGDYTARAIAAGITNASGQAMPADHVLEFFFLRGDANRDRTVNLADFNILATNFGQSNRTFSQGDFNYDNVVNLADFNILAIRFGTALAPDGSVQRTSERMPSLQKGNPLDDVRALGDDRGKRDYEPLLQLA